MTLQGLLRVIISDMKRRTFVLGAAGLGAIGLAGWLAYRETSKSAPRANRALVAAAPQINVPNTASLFEAVLPDTAGREWAMTTFLGQPLVVNFWATWCAPCVQEMPVLDELSKKQLGVQFVGIGIDHADNVRQFVTKVPVSYPLLVAGHGGIALVRDLGNRGGGLPFTVMFDANGGMIDTILGQVEPADLQRRVAALVTK